MTALQIASLLVVLAGAFGAINHLFLKLPSSSGIQVMALDTMILGLDITRAPRAKVVKIDFSDALPEGMPSLLLFAGALHVKPGDLRAQRRVVFLMATLGVGAHNGRPAGSPTCHCWWRWFLARWCRPPIRSRCRAFYDRPVCVNRWKPGSRANRCSMTGPAMWCSLCWSALPFHMAMRMAAVWRVRPGPFSKRRSARSSARDDVLLCLGRHCFQLRPDTDSDASDLLGRDPRGHKRTACHHIVVFVGKTDCSMSQLVDDHAPIFPHDIDGSVKCKLSPGLP